MLVGRMEVKVNGGTLVLKHKLKKNETYRISEGSKFKSVTIMKKPQIVKGFSNECEDTMGILVIDYDNCDKSVVEEDFRAIQGRYGLPIGYLFKTKDNNFHIICLKKFTQTQLYEILQNTRADENFKTMLLRNPYRSWVLRLSDKKGSKKPKFLGLIGENKNLGYEISSAHLNLLQKLYKLPKIDYKKKDNLKELRINVYETSSN